jgi:hypothetical protein
MIQGEFHTDFGTLFITLAGTPTPEQVKEFLPHFEESLNKAVETFLQYNQEANRAASN